MLEALRCRAFAGQKDLSQPSQDLPPVVDLDTHFHRVRRIDGDAKGREERIGDN